jgi:hypothetical protein
MAFFFRTPSLTIECSTCGGRGPCSITVFQLEAEAARGALLCAACTRRVHEPIMHKRLVDGTDEKVWVGQCKGTRGTRMGMPGRGR